MKFTFSHAVNEVTKKLVAFYLCSKKYDKDNPGEQIDGVCLDAPEMSVEVNGEIAHKMDESFWMWVRHAGGSKCEVLMETPHSEKQ